MRTANQLYVAIKSEPDSVWDEVLSFVREHPESAAAGGLIEELIYEHNELFLDRIEAATLQDPVVREVVEQAYVGGVATNGGERFHRLQEIVRSRATNE